MKNATVIVSLLFITTFFSSCKKDEDPNHDAMQEVCEMCNSHCCEQVGTENCCCVGM